VKEAVIVDSGGANLASLRCALERLQCRAEVSREGSTIASAERVILPGVGAAGHAMERLRSAGLVNVLRTLTQPVLGVCLGMQLLLERSEEGPTRCLGLLPCAARTLSPAPGHPVPHMGWNTLESVTPDPLLEGVEAGAWAYFVHSYAAPVSEHTVATTRYGVGISAIVRRANFWGTQFHPERSSHTGARILANFLAL
jgi:glutamine amidotransferase